MIKNIYIQYSEFRADCFAGPATSCSKVLKDKKYCNTVKSFRATLFFRARKLFKNLNAKKISVGPSGEARNGVLPLA